MRQRTGDQRPAARRTATVRPGPLLRLLPDGDGAGVRVEVHGSGAGVPAGDVREAGEGGRGLLLVSELADKWGVGEPNPGKIVWCEVGTVRTATGHVDDNTDAIDVIAPGPTRQHPPTSRAPAARQPST